MTIQQTNLEGDAYNINIMPTPSIPRSKLQDALRYVSGVAAAGEANTASNHGTGGVGLFYQKSGVDLQFKNIKAGSAVVTVTDDAGLHTVDIDLDQTQISISKSQVSGLGTAAGKDIPASGDASSSQVVYGSDTRLTNSRAPSGSAGGDLTGTFPNPTIGANKVDFTKLLAATQAAFIGATAAGNFSERTPAQVTAALSSFVGDSGGGGTKGLVPAPGAGDAATPKWLKADGNWAQIHAAAVADLATIATSGLITDATGTLAVGHGGTGLTAPTNHALLIGKGASALSDTGAGTAGQVVKSAGASADPAFADDLVALSFVIGDGTNVISTGLAGWFASTFAGTITKAVMLADASGSIVVDIFKTTYSNYNPGTHPVSGDKITASAPPTISSTYKSSDAVLTGWTTTFAADDVFAFNVNSIATCKRVTLTLYCKRS